MNLLKKISKTVVALSTTVAVLAATAMPTFAAAKHTVTFIYGTNVTKVVVDDGCNAVPPTNTYVPGYNFLGWVGNATNVKSDITILGAYAQAAPTPAPAPAPAPAANCSYVTYHVRFVDTLTGAEYYNQTVSDGANANPPEVPYHPGYHFNGYNGNYENVHSDTTIYTMYEMDNSCWHEDPSDQWWLYHDGDGNFNEPYIDYWWNLAQSQ